MSYLRLSLDLGIDTRLKMGTRTTSVLSRKPLEGYQGFFVRLQQKEYKVSKDKWQVRKF